MTRYSVRPEKLRSVCPGCKRMRFIPIQTAPYCTPSCKRDAEQPGAQEPGKST